MERRVPPLSRPDGSTEPGESNDRTIGLILCGGQSSRMGREKGLVPLPKSSESESDVTFVDNAIALLRPFVSQVYLSLREEQASLYESRVEGCKQVRFIFDEPVASGPVRGLLSAHRAMPEASILLLAVDMIRLQGRHIQALLEREEPENEKRSACYRHASGHFEPLIAYYRSDDLHRIAKWSAASPQAGLSYWLQKLQIRALPITDAEAPFFISQNSEQETTRIDR